jgi:hypothetical protein
MTIRIVETPQMGDWLRRGPKAVREVLVSHGHKNPCKVAREMKEKGEDKAPIFRDLIKACREMRARPRSGRRARNRG